MQQECGGSLLPLSSCNKTICHFLNTNSLNASRPHQRFTLGGCLSNHLKPTNVLLHLFSVSFAFEFYRSYQMFTKKKNKQKKPPLNIYPIKAYPEEVEELNCILNAPKTCPGRSLKSLIDHCQGWRGNTKSGRISLKVHKKRWRLRPMLRKY